MSRTYTTKTLIQLPRLSGRETLVLVTELQTEAAAAKTEHKLESLPAPVERSLARVVAAAEPLNAILAPQTEADTQRKRKADRVIDNAWSAFHAWLQGWCLLPPEVVPLHDKAATLNRLIFAEGLEFTQRPYKIEWQESHTRLEAIDRDGHADLVDQLGGTLFLDHIRQSHRAYGDALHITKARPAATDDDVRTKHLALLDTIRDYATRCAAVADPDEPGSDKLAEALLKPITLWETRSATPTEPDPEIAPDPPVPANAATDADADADAEAENPQ